MNVLRFLLAACLVCTASAAVRPVNLRCEYLTNPSGIDVREPRLSWMLVSPEAAAKNVHQAAYRILVASSEANLKAGTGDLWDTGRIASDESIQIPYAGKPLSSRQQAFWRVQVWDTDAKAGIWSETARWSMGLLSGKDWTGQWIGRDETALYKNPKSPYWDLAKASWIWSEDAGLEHAFRTTFDAPAQLRTARLIVAADERGSVLLNGERIGSTGPLTIPTVHDIAQRVKPGRNTLVVTTRNPNRKPGGLIASIRLNNAEPLISGTSWETAPKPDAPKWQPAKEIGAFGVKPWGEIGFEDERTLPARYLRKEFATAAPVRKAVIFLSGLGSSELYFNGAKVTDDVLSPGLTDYDKHVLYVTRDVTRLVANGKNAIGVILGNGRFWGPRATEPIAMRSYGVPRLLFQMEIEYADGRTQSIVSDETWKVTSSGPIRANNEFDGEEYDARMELRDWSRPGFDDSQWQSAARLSAPKGEMAAQMAEPLRVIETIHPQTVSEPSPGVFVFDMGQNMVGWCRLHVQGIKGTEVSLRHSETLQPNGTLYVDNLRSARAQDIYTLNGAGAEVYEPRFTYHGFRYVEVRGYPGKPPLSALEGRVIHDAMSPAGTFNSSDAMLNRLHRNIYWGIRSNYRSIPTDCPQRDERQGWLGDRSTVSRSESYLFDVAAFYTKWERDIADSQRDNGSVPDVAPNFWSIYNDDVTWPSTFLLVPSMLYDQYADTRVMARFYPAMKKWVEHMQTYIRDGIVTKDTYGDWCVPPERKELIHSQDPARKTKGSLLSTAYFYRMLQLMSHYATVQNLAADASEFNAQAATLKAAFQREFFRKDAGQYDNGTQTSSILPLMFGITPEQDRQMVFQGLVRRIEVESNNHVGTGLVGAQWLMRTLSDNGRADLAHTIATQTTYPGWGYMIEKGATTVWELWNGDTADPGMNSGNHVMQIGDLNVWLYEYLGGIRPDPAHPGFKHTMIRPYPIRELQFVKATHRSMYGEIRTAWTRNGNQLSLQVTIPPNTTATVYWNGKEHEIGSGTYNF